MRGRRLARQSRRARTTAPAHRRRASSAAPAAHPPAADRPLSGRQGSSLRPRRAQQSRRLRRQTSNSIQSPGASCAGQRQVGRNDHGQLRVATGRLSIRHQQDRVAGWRNLQAAHERHVGDHVAATASSKWSASRQPVAHAIGLRRDREARALQRLERRRLEMVSLRTGQHPQSRAAGLERRAALLSLDGTRALVPVPSGTRSPALERTAGNAAQSADHVRGAAAQDWRPLRRRRRTPRTRASRSDDRRSAARCPSNIERRAGAARPRRPALRADRLRRSR